MDNDDFQAMLAELTPHAQAQVFYATLWRWLRRPQRRWSVSDVYPVVYLLG